MKTPNPLCFFLVCSFCCLFLQTPVNAQPAEGKNTITIEGLKSKMYFLASDYLKGRQSYDQGYEIAAQYCASQFTAAGLVPVIKDSLGNPTFFQDVPLTRITYDSNISISLVGPDGTTMLESGKDFVIPDKLNDIPKSEVELVFAGYGINEPRYNWNDFKDLDITGKALIVLMGTPKKKGKPVLPDSIDMKYHSVDGIMTKLMPLLPKKPAAFIVITDKKLLEEIPWEKLPNYTGGDQYFYSREYDKARETQVPVFYALHPSAVPKLFRDQPYDPGVIEKDGLKGYKCFTLKDLRLRSNFSILSTGSVTSKNVVALLPGTDENLKDQYIVVTAHLDGIPPVKGEICNAANDNASGSAGVLEVASAMAQSPGRRPVIFILFCGEELFLVGSHHFLNECPVPVDSIVADINLDMIGRTLDKNKDTRAQYVEAHSKYLEPMTKLISEVNSAGENWPLIFENCDKMAGDSDHSSFDDKGIPNVFFYSGHLPDTHSPDDDADKIDYEKMQKIIRLVYDVTVRMANMEVLPF